MQRAAAATVEEVEVSASSASMYPVSRLLHSSAEPMLTGGLYYSVVCDFTCCSRSAGVQSTNSDKCACSRAPSASRSSLKVSSVRSFLKLLTHLVRRIQKSAGLLPSVVAGIFESSTFVHMLAG